MTTAPFLSARDTADVLSTGQAARRLGCSETWVRRLISDGRLTATETPLGHLIDRVAVEQLAQERSEASHA